MIMKPADPPSSIRFVTRDLTPAESTLQAGWAKSNAGLLAVLEVEGARITIRRRNGAEDVLQQGQFHCTVYRTGSGRRLFVIGTDDGRKIRLLEMAGSLSAAQWDAIAEVLHAQPSQLNSRITQAGISLLGGMLGAAVSVDVVVGFFELDAAQLAISSPLSLGLIAGWALALWFAGNWLRRHRNRQ